MFGNSEDAPRSSPIQVCM